MTVPSSGAAREESAQQLRQLINSYSTRELSGHKRRVCTLGWSSNGRKLASGSADTSIKIWNVESHSQVARPERAETELKGHAAPVSHLCWKPGSDSVLASAAGDKNDRTIRMWDARASKCTASLTTSNNNLYVTWSPDGMNLASINSDDTLSIIDVRRAKVLKAHHFTQERVQMHEIHWGPTLQQLMLATSKGTVDVVSMPSMELLWSLKGHSAATYCFSADKDYKYLVSGGGDALVALWDLDAQCCVRTWRHMDHGVRSVSLSSDGKLVAYASEQGELEVLSAETGERLVDVRLRTPGSDGVAWSPTHNVLAYCDEAPDPQSGPRDMRPSLVGVIGIMAPPK